MYRLARGELGGPFTRSVFQQLNPLLPTGVTGQWGVWLYIIFFGPALAVVFLYGTDLLLSNGRVWLEVLGVAALVAGGGLAALVLYLLAIGRTRERWATHVKGWSAKDLVWWGWVMFLAPTVAFAASAALLVHQRIMAVSGVPAHGPNLAFKTFETFETFAWNLADTVPLLTIPETLHWKAQLQFTTTAGGALVLAYKLVFIFPLAQLAAQATSALFGDQDVGVPGDEQTVALAERTGCVLGRACHPCCAPAGSVRRRARARAARRAPRIPPRRAARWSPAA
jgi:hypothetical protein